MDIATKVLAWGVGGALAGGLALFSFQAFLIVPYLDRIETLTAHEKATQVVNLFRSDVSTFARTVDDWSYWNDTVEFVAGRNPDYEDDNLYPAAFQSVHVSTMVFFRIDGTVFWAGEVSADGRRLVAPTHLEAYQTQLRSLGAVEREEGREGYIALPGRYDMAVVRPIRSEEEPEVARGFLLMTQRLEPSFWASYQARMGLTVTPSAVRPLPDSLLVPQVRASPDQSRTSLRIPLEDLLGRVNLVLEAQQPRTLAVTGMNLLTQVMVGSIAILLLTTLGNLVFVRYTLVRPVRALWRLTLELEATANWNLRSEAKAADEIGQLARGINSLIASVQEKTAQLESMAAQDALTGLANRRSFDTAMALAWRSCLRKRLPLGFIMGDVDQFKRFNDRYGHRAGDVCLKMVAQVIQDSALRPGDVKARYGGEEFAVILPETDAEGTRLVAERIRTHVELVGLPHEDNPNGLVTISLGAVSVVPEAGTSWETLVEQADKRLYQAKAEGRNRVKP